MTTSEKIRRRCDEVCDLLLTKNAAYGNAALEPIHIFSKLDSTEGLKQRIDDKLARIATVGLNADTEDTLLDITGYLILLSIAYDEVHNH